MPILSETKKHQRACQSRDFENVGTAVARNPSVLAHVILHVCV